jgi:hypothetical protein
LCWSCELAYNGIRTFAQLDLDNMMSRMADAEMGDL